MTVYILLLNWNGKNYTPKCIDNIRKQDYNSVRTFIGEQGSTDGSAELLRSAPTEWFDLIDFRSNLGFSVGYNEMIELIKSKYGDPDYWFFLNNDTKLFPDAVSQLVKVLQMKYEYGIAGLNAYNYDTGKKIEGFGGWIIRDDSKAQTNGGFGKYWTDGTYGYKPGMENEDFFEDDYESGGNMMVKNHVLNAVWSKYGRWFDPDFNPLYSEDVDVCCEIRQLGYKVLHVNRSGFYHKVQGSTNKDFLEKWWPISLKNHDLFVKKWKALIDKGVV